MLRATKCWYFSKFLLVLLCCVGFFFQMRTEFNKFASGRTTVAVSFDAVEEYRLPTLAFCPTEGFATCRPGLRGTEESYRDSKPFC